MRFSVQSTRLFLRNSVTRLPFRYGKACLTRCPQAILEATITTDRGRSTGYAGDCLPPGWFDKSPEKDYRRQVQDMLDVIRFSQRSFQEIAGRPTDLFTAWLECHDRAHRWAEQRDLPPLLASFGVSMSERALMDAAARAANLSFSQAVRRGVFGIRGGDVFDELAGQDVAEWLPEQPSSVVFVRHTVGLGDPLTEADIPSDERLDDGLPQSLEQYVSRLGIRYLKVKVSNDLDVDLARLATIADLMRRYRGDDYRVTLDGNEQYGSAEEFDRLVDSIESSDDLRTLWSNTLWIEQPLRRSLALDPSHTGAIRLLGERKPVIIDESDGRLDSYRQAASLGYRGVSSKNCKGPIKSLLNAGLVWSANRRDAATRHVISGEDLCTVGVVPTQSDLCLAATLGLTHVERNGHHYHPGLSYLSRAEQEDALAAHGDFYGEHRGIVGPRIVDGRFRIGSLQCVGYGFAALPDADRMTPVERWTFDSLGIEDDSP